MQACSQIALLAIGAAVMSIVRWLKNKESSPLLSVGDASTSAANKEVAKVDAQHRKKRGTYHYCDDDIRAKIANYSCIYKPLKPKCQ